MDDSNDSQDEDSFYELDTDNDKLSDEDELSYGTNSNSPDTDGDGFTDGFEALSGYDPLSEMSHPAYNYARRFSNSNGEGTIDSQDPDNDGLPSTFEEEIGTLADNPDSDEDGIHDGIEMANNLDPLEPNDSIGPDSDNDGLADAFEAIYGASKHSADIDNDGLADIFEILRGFDPKDPDTNDNGILDSYEIGPFNYRYKSQLWHFD